MRVAIYTRVSTDEQTTENQKLELFKVVEHRNWTVTKIFEDQGISGAKGRDQRPGQDELLKCCLRGEVDIVAVWSVARRACQHGPYSLHRPGCVISRTYAYVAWISSEMFDGTRS